MHQISPIATTLWKSPSLPSTTNPIPFHSRHMNTLLRFPSFPLQPNPQPLETTTLAVTVVGGRIPRRRRREAAERTALRCALSVAASLRKLLPPEPLDLLLQQGGNGNGGLGFWNGGGSGWGWFEGRRRWSRSGLLGILLSVAIGAALSVFEKTPERDLGIRALVPALMGFKIRVWRRWVEVLVLGFGFYVLLTGLGSRREGRRRMGRLVR